MNDATRPKRLRSRLFGAVPRRLPANLAPVVQGQTPETLIEELKRQLNEQVLSELEKHLGAIIACELTERIGAILDRELPGRLEAIIHSRVLARQPPNVNKVLVDRFTRVFRENLWGAIDTVSGLGSQKDSVSVAEALSALRAAKEKIRFVSMNDIPCGDFNWINTFLTSVPEIRYRGFDIVETLVEQNKKSYSEYSFEVIDITSMIPPYADLILSKDLFNHLTYKDINKAFANMKASNSKYLLASNNFGFSNQELPENVGSCSRYLDLCSEPFNLPDPIWRTNYMGLWEFSDIKKE